MKKNNVLGFDVVKHTITILTIIAMIVNKTK
jgi:hypothetical protein